MMKGSGSALFTDPDDYRANLPGLVDFVVPRVRDFSARLTWMDLTDLRLLHIRETVPRVAHVSLPTEFVFITFPTRRTPALICDGIQLELGDIVVHSLGQRLHQRTTAATAWGLIALTPASLQAYGRTFTEINIALTPFGQILRSRPSDARCLLRLHAEAIRIAETKLSHIGHAEVARAVQQEMIGALAGCLVDAGRRSISTGPSKSAATGLSDLQCNRSVGERAEEPLPECPWDASRTIFAASASRARAFGTAAYHGERSRSDAKLRLCGSAPLRRGLPQCPRCPATDRLTDWLARRPALGLSAAISDSA